MVKIVDFINYKDSVSELFDNFEWKKMLSGYSKIMIKPNLVNTSRFPVTTPFEICEAIIAFLREITNKPIIIAEGCGDPSYETSEIFEILGYGKLKKKYGVDLVDLNHEPLIKKSDKNCPRFPEIYLPEILFSHFVISVPVLKAHSLSVITGSMKNMVGTAPPKYYAESGGIWNKSAFHRDIHQAVIDLNRYRTPDFSVMDATVGLKDYHLGGSTCSPYVNKLIAGEDAKELDRKAAELIGIDYRRVDHLK